MSAPADTSALSDVKPGAVSVRTMFFKIILSNSAKMFSLVRWHFYCWRNLLDLYTLCVLRCWLLEPNFPWITRSSYFLQRLQSGTKNIVRHTAHTIVSWPNPKQWLMIKAADDDAGKLQPVFLKRLYLLHICIFSFFRFTASLTTIWRY